MYFAINMAKKSIGRIYWRHVDQFLLNLKLGNMIQALLIPSAFLKKSSIFQFAKSIYCWYISWHLAKICFLEIFSPPVSFLSSGAIKYLLGSQSTSPFIFSLPDCPALIKLDHLKTSFFKIPHMLKILHIKFYHISQTLHIITSIKQEIVVVDSWTILHFKISHKEWGY